MARMSKKATRDAWMYGIIGFGVAALVGYPALMTVYKYWTSDAANKKRIENSLKVLAA